MKNRMQNRIGLSCILLGLLLPLAGAAQSLIPIGRTAGIHLESDGALVIRLSEVQTAQGARSPAQQAGLAPGDLITAVDGGAVQSNEELQQQIARSDGQPLALTVQREGEALTCQVTPCADESGVYRIGVMTRDGLAGIGTLTYVDPETGAYGSLGHAICEAETGVLLPLRAGELLQATVDGVQKGTAGAPGALQGSFEESRIIGTVERNTEQGIFGTLTDTSLYRSLEAVEVAEPEEITVGPAQILSNVSGDKVEAYEVEILKLYPETDADGRGLMLKVTDPALLRQTGGIVQGMSGSPILENGKLIGAVTHVLVNDPTCGYGIFLSNMLEK